MGKIKKFFNSYRMYSDDSEIKKSLNCDRSSKIQKRFSKIKWRFVIYMTLCVVISFTGSAIIGNIVNNLQDWYLDINNARLLPDYCYEYHIWFEEGNEEGRITKELSGSVENTFDKNKDETISEEFIEQYRDFIPVVEKGIYKGQRFQKAYKKQELIFELITNSQIIIIPIWIFFCVIVAGKIFYGRELKKPIELLLTASKKIADNQLDFEIHYEKPNEMGMLCMAFDEMRQTLYENNREMWRSLEERKRLNSAFSHDLRTPLTVLRGYTDFLEKYIPSGKVSEQKLLEVLGMMNGQVARLEHYTRKMNSVQKLEDIVPNPSYISALELKNNLLETGKFLCGEKQFSLQWKDKTEEKIYIDTEIFFQIYENLVANASHYAKNKITVQCMVDGHTLKFTVSDDGDGFCQETIAKAAEPFFRDEKEPDKIHFGLGLYICRTLCEKCGGELIIENGEKGGKVTATIRC